MLSENQKEILRQNISSSLLHYDLAGAIQMLDQYPSLLLDSNYKIKESNIKFNLPQKGLTLLHLAAFADFLEAFVYFTESKQIPILISSSDSFLPLHYALSCNSLEIVNFIFMKVPELFSSTNNQIKNVNHSFLFYAIESNELKIVQFLFNHGYSLRDPFNSRDLPLVIKKVVTSYPKLFNCIIEKIGNLSSTVTQSDDKLSLIMLAVISGNGQLVQSLIENSLDQSLDFASWNGNSAFFYACAKKQEETANIIFENMKKVEDNALYVHSICYCLCKLCSPSLVRTILFADSYDIFCDPENIRIFKKGINLLKLSPNKEPPLFALLDDENLEKDNLPKVFEIIDLFMEKGYPIDFQPEGKNTLLGEACLGLYRDNKKPLELIQFLLKKGANPYAIVSIKKIPLFDYLKKIGSTRERSEEMKPLITLFEPYVEQYLKDQKSKKMNKNH